MTSEQQIVHALNDAHAIESALVQTLTAHLAMTPRSAYRDLLERHLGETKDHAGAILGRLAELGESRNPLELVYGIAQTALGQLLASAKFPIDLLRGTGGEEKLLRNARDESASEALEIATYDALEALAQAAGDEQTASLARRHRDQEEAFLRDLRALIPQLARDAFEAQSDGGSGSFDVARSGAADAARAVASEVQRTVSRVAPAADEAPLPIEDYDTLPVQQIVPKLRLLTMPDLVRVEEHERAGRQRKAVLDRIAKLRASTNGATGPMPRR